MSYRYPTMWFLKDDATRVIDGAMLDGVIRFTRKRGILGRGFHKLFTQEHEGGFNFYH